jgi:hypothetical protein
LGQTCDATLTTAAYQADSETTNYSTTKRHKVSLMSCDLDTQATDVLVSVSGGGSGGSSGTFSGTSTLVVPDIFRIDESQGALIAGAILLVWSAAFGARLVIRALRDTDGAAVVNE